MTIGSRKQRAGDYREHGAGREPARFTKRSTRSHRRKHDVGIHVAADYAPSSLATYTHTRRRGHKRSDTRACARVSARKQRISIHFSPVRDLVSPGITAAFYPCAHHVTEAAITNLEARPSRAKSLGFAARRGRPLSHVICMKRVGYIYALARYPLAGGRKEAREWRDRGPQGRR